MKPEDAQRDRKALAIFGRALELTSAEARAGYLEDACGGNETLKARVEALLANHVEDTFLQKPAAALSSVGAVGTPITEQPGDQIGRYKLLEKLGEGGFGVVYMAEQSEPVKRRVALKIIKVGMDTREVVARFEAERQALALMDHPKIAKIHDAGATETGRPYFVMELVRGIKLTDYCDGRNVPTRERLELFMQVCQAVQHAHQKGIIHRDLKPSNILVTVNDGQPVPKIIDFGIAKATQMELTEKTVFTRFQQFLGTPAYMSPEQADLSSVDIDTRSDIYSLGVLLYELLTGKTPFDARELLKAGLDEMRRTIREKEPERPSTRVSTLRGEERTTTAKRRGLDAPKLINVLRGDLDWIVMKCLEKDRARRYETANGLSADIQRHLSNEPVIARPPSTAYRFQKMVRRNRVAFLAGGAVAAALVGGLGLSTWLFFKERAARARVEAQQRRAENAEKHASEETAIAQALDRFLIKDVLRVADIDEQRQRVGAADPNITLVEALDRAAANVGDRFRSHPMREAAIRGMVGRAYQSLGDDRRAIPQLERSLALCRMYLGNRHPQMLFNLRKLWQSYLAERRLSEALELGKELLQLYAANTGSDRSNLVQELQDRESFAITLRRVDPTNNAQAIAILEDVVKRGQETQGFKGEPLASVMITLAESYMRTGQKVKAFEVCEAALATARETADPNNSDLGKLMFRVAVQYQNNDRPADAVPLYEHALEFKRARGGTNDPGTIDTLTNLGLVYQGLRRFAAAEAVLREVLELARRQPRSAQWPRCQILLGKLYAEMRQDAPAERFLLDGVQAARKNAAHSPATLADGLYDYAEFLYRRDRLAEAERACQEAHQTYRSFRPETHADVIDAAACLGRVWAEIAWRQAAVSRPSPSLAAGNPAVRLESANTSSGTDVQSMATNRVPAELAREAERLLRECVANSGQLGTNSRWRLFERRNRLGGALVAVVATDTALPNETTRLKLTEAESLLQEADRALQPNPTVGRKYKRDSLVRLERLYLAWPNPEKAAEAQRRLEEFDRQAITNQTVNPEASP